MARSGLSVDDAPQAVSGASEEGQGERDAHRGAEPGARPSDLVADGSERHTQSERVRCERDRAHDDADYRELYEDAPIGYLTLGEVDEVILKANRTFDVLIGAPAGSLVGRRFTSVMRARDAEVFRRLRGELGALRERAACELRLLRADGRSIPVRLDMTAAPYGGAGDRCAVVDLSDLRGARDGLRASDERTRELLASLDEVLYLISPDGSPMYVSPGFEEVYRRPLSDVLAEPSCWREMLHPDDRERVIAALARACAGAAVDHEYRIVRPDGETRWVRDRARARVDGDGRIDCVIGVVSDVTEARSLDERLRHAQKMEAVGALATGIAHDFANVLQAIAGCAALASRETTPPERAREYMRRASDAAMRGGDLATRLMSFARKDAREPKPLAVDAALATSAKLLESLLGEHVGLVIQPGAPRAVVMASFVDLEHILMNLAANARDAMPYGGALVIRSEEVTLDHPEARAAGVVAGRFARLTLRDEGIGMSEATRHRAFEPFFTTKGGGQGTGMGLATVLATVRELGGRVDVDSAPGAGTTFTVLLPCTGERAKSSAREGAPVELRFQGTALVVEDEPLVRMIVRHYLEELGLCVIEASCGDDARRLARALDQPLELLVSDVMMPGTIGPRLAEELGRRFPGMRTLFISAHPRGYLVARGTLPAEGVLLQKPFGRDELATKLAEVLPPVTRDHSLSGARTRTVLLVEDGASQHLLARLLSEVGHRVIAVSKPSEALDAARVLKFDVAVLDLRLPEMNGDALAGKLVSACPGLRPVFLSAAAFHPASLPGPFLQKPVDLDALVAEIERGEPS
jgi:two-component system, cell cycle sensor histidine kinase and response regulator CckA